MGLQEPCNEYPNSGGCILHKGHAPWPDGGYFNYAHFTMQGHLFSVARRSAAKKQCGAFPEHGGCVLPALHHGWAALTPQRHHFIHLEKSVPMNAIAPKDLHELFVSWVAAGFSEDQALKLIAYTVTSRQGL